MTCCEQFEEHIWEAAETGAACPALEEHIARCRECRRMLQGLSSAMAGFAVLRDVRAPDPRAAVRARLAAPQRKWWPIPAMAGSLAVACLIAFFALTVSRAPKVVPPARHAITPKRQAFQKKNVSMARAPEPEKQHSSKSEPTPSRHRQMRHAAPRVVAFHKPCVGPKAPSLATPCSQVTVVVMKVDQQPERPAEVANPAYCCAVLPKVILAPAPDPRMIP